MWETQVRFLGREDPLEKEMATHSSTLAWKIPWMEESDRLQSMGLQRVGHNWVTELNWTEINLERNRSISHSCHVESTLKAAEVYLLGELEDIAANWEMNKLTWQGIHCSLIITLLCFANRISKYHIATKGIITTGMMELRGKQHKRKED